MSLKELFLTRVNKNKVRRIKQNENNVLIRNVSRITWLTRIFPYLLLEDSLKMGQTCMYFSQLTRSPLYVKMQVSMNEKTKIDVSLNRFGGKGASMGALNLF